MPPNIYIIGAQSTGKTTLVNGLASFFAQQARIPQPVITSELTRSVLHSNNLPTSDLLRSPDLALEFQKLIITTQAAAELDALTETEAKTPSSPPPGSDPSPWLISDRSAIDPIIYTHTLVSLSAVHALTPNPSWLAMKARMMTSLVSICEPGCPSWLRDDGVRLMPNSTDEWRAFHELFCRLLDEMGMRYVVLPGDVRDIVEGVE